METGGISKLTLQRLPTYLSYLRTLPQEEGAAISAAAIASALGLGEVQVRKDLATVSDAGKPKVGYLIADLMRDLEHFLGYGTRNRAVLIGVGNLGLALLSYGGFADYGLNIVAAFDNKSALIGSAVDGRPVLDIQGPARLLPEGEDPDRHPHGAGLGGAGVLKRPGRGRCARGLELCAGAPYGAGGRAGPAREHGKLPGPFVLPSQAGGKAGGKRVRSTPRRAAADCRRKDEKWRKQTWVRKLRSSEQAA